MLAKKIVRLFFDIKVTVIAWYLTNDKYRVQIARNIVLIYSLYTFGDISHVWSTRRFDAVPMPQIYSHPVVTIYRQFLPFCFSLKFKPRALPLIDAWNLICCIYLKTRLLTVIFTHFSTCSKLVFAKHVYRNVFRGIRRPALHTQRQLYSIAFQNDSSDLKKTASL